MWIDTPRALALDPPASRVPPGLPPAVAARCGITEADWTRMLLDLLPVGWAWPRDPETTLARFWSAVAVELTRIQGRDCDLLAESYPCGAVELLPDWEAAVGLPNECTELVPWTVAERQALVCAWLALQGGQSIAYFTWLAALFGYDVTIQEHIPPARAGAAQAGCATVGSCPFWWTVTIDGVPRTIPRAGCTRAGEPPCGSGVSIIECLFRMFAPAHTVVTFRYPSPEVTRHAYDA
jgi:uncharacterized protein YmfQ (DUF2313 family)